MCVYTVYTMYIYVCIYICIFIMYIYICKMVFVRCILWCWWIYICTSIYLSIYLSIYIYIYIYIHIYIYIYPRTLFAAPLYCYLLVFVAVAATFMGKDPTFQYFEFLQQWDESGSSRVHEKGKIDRSAAKKLNWDATYCCMAFLWCCCFFRSRSIL